MIKTLVNEHYSKFYKYFSEFNVADHQTEVLQSRNLRKVHLVTESLPDEISSLIVKEYFSDNVSAWDLNRLKKNSFGLKIHHAGYAYKAEKRINREFHITPKIYAIQRHKNMFQNIYSIQFQEYLHGYTEYLSYLNELTSTKEKIKSIKNVAKLVSIVHKQNVFLLDINLRNILVKNNDYKVIDLDAAIILKFPFSLLGFVFRSFDINCLGHFLKKAGHKKLNMYLFLKYARINGWSRFKTRLFFKLLGKKFFSL